MAKGPEAFRSISEASDALGVAQHVLRFWESRFSFIRPMKRAGGRRFYRRQDLDVLRGVRALLHEEGYTIKGVQQLHREEGLARVTAAGHAAQAAPDGAEPGGASRERASPSPAASQPAPAPAVLGTEARRRLQAVLEDLERARAAVDRLAAPAPKSRLPGGEPPPIRRVP